MDLLEAIKKVQNGREQSISAFEFLIEKFKNRIFTVCYRIIGNIEDAKDISQDTFVEIYMKLKTLQDPRKFSVWIYKIAVNKSINFLRKKRRVLLFSKANSFVTEEKDKEIIKRDTINFLLNRLTPDYRAVLVLFYIEDKTIKEIASILDITESAVKMRLKRAREKLKKFTEV
ncbi:MAG: sigma-70 family RNA polymerase sigma factor [Candidatus Aminicenantaceae bacterium]